MGVVFFVPLSVGWALVTAVLIAVHRIAAGLAGLLPWWLRAPAYVVGLPVGLALAIGVPVLCMAMLGMAIQVAVRWHMGVPILAGAQ